MLPEKNNDAEQKQREIDRYQVEKMLKDQQKK